MSMRLCFVVVAVAVSAHAGGLTSRALGGQAANPDAKKLVLQLSDVPRGFARTLGSYRSNIYIARKNKIPLSKVESWGRINGYTVEYERRGVSGPLVIISTVSVHRAAPGAHTAFLWANAELVKRGSRVVHTSAARLGDESQVFTRREKADRVYRIFLVEWRESRFVATATVIGVEGKLTVKSALTLASRQQARLRKAG